MWRDTARDVTFLGLDAWALTVQAPKVVCPRPVVECRIQLGVTPAQVAGDDILDQIVQEDSVRAVFNIRQGAKPAEQLVYVLLVQQHSQQSLVQ